MTSVSAASSVFFVRLRADVAHGLQVLIEHLVESGTGIYVATPRLAISSRDHVVDTVDSTDLVPLAPRT